MGKQGSDGCETKLICFSLLLPSPHPNGQSSKKCVFFALGYSSPAPKKRWNRHSPLPPSSFHHLFKIWRQKRCLERWKGVERGRRRRNIITLLRGGKDARNSPLSILNAFSHFFSASIRRISFRQRRRGLLLSLHPLRAFRPFIFFAFFLPLRASSFIFSAKVL